ncbi:MAG: lamin tail domain-containing protein [Thermoplasmata archaeon]|nr:MAG: lamin tail domain-containing protein [Thermoplasmata archaeon]
MVRGGYEIPAKRNASMKRKLFSFTAIVWLVLGSLIIVLPPQVPNATAGNVTHDVGELQIKMLTDFGRIWMPLQWPKNSKIQTVGHSGWGYIGLVIDQANYDHSPGSVDIADCYKSGSQNYMSQDDFIGVSTIDMIIDDGTTQKSIATFMNNRTTQDYNDVLINQTCWTVKDKDWAILQWDVVNIKSPASDITDFCLGLEVDISQEGAGYGLGGDSGDDIDGFDGTNDVYWAQDDGDTTMGFGSVTDSNPITHYFSYDYHPTDMNDYKANWGNETWLYERIRAPNSLEGSSQPGNRTATVGWNGVTIPIGSSKTFTLVISINGTFDDMITAQKDAQYYYRTVATGFRITEFSDADSVSQQIEVFNFGSKATDLAAEGYFLSLDGGTTPLTGNWDKNPLGTNEYGIFTLGAGSIGPEGDTIGLYQDLGGGNTIVWDAVSYGQEGWAPDPLGGESVERRYDDATHRYTSFWLRNASSGPTWGGQNDVPVVDPSPAIVINEVIFNPGIPELGFVELMCTRMGNYNIQGYKIVCDTEYTISASIILNSSNPYFTLFQFDDPTFFSQMDPSGDNIYLYDNNGQLLDMFGWSSPHLLGMSASRIPDGNGTYQGYNDVTSEAASWVFNLPLDVVMTEISDSASAVARIEVYNPWYPQIDFRLGFTINSFSFDGQLSGTWTTPIATSGGYGIFTVSTPNGLNREGDTIQLYQNDILLEEISYGYKGMVPDPLQDESAERYWDGTGYLDVWGRNWTSGPNFGAQNDIPLANLTSFVVLNEVLFNPNVVDDYFVEVYSRSRLSQDISGFKIVCDTEYIVPNGTILNINQEFFYLNYVMDPAFFDPNMDVSGDNVYLYDANGTLIDMVGWSSQHTVGGSVCRIPDGNGTSDGYDDASSIAALWQFNCVPTVELIKIDLQNRGNPIIYGEFMEHVDINLTIRNLQQDDDLISISNSSEEGWTIEIFDGITLLKISDITLTAGSQGNITVNVTLPDSVPFAVMDNITISIRSSNSAIIGDNIVLNVRLYPFIQATKSGNPVQIYVNGTGHSEELEITLTAQGTGATIEAILSNAADIVFVVDDTGSMGSVIDHMKSVILQITEIFTQEIVSVRFGLVSYKDWPERDQELTFNTADFIFAVMGLYADGGGDWREDVYGALEMAIDSNWRSGNVTKVIILIGDAEDHDPYSPCPLVAAAYNGTWGIFTNTIASSDNQLTLDTFKAIAENGSGIYNHYLGLSSEDLADAIIDAVLTVVPRLDVAAKDLDIFDDNPMIRDVLPDYIDYVDGSATIVPDAKYQDGNGNTVLEWNIREIIVGDVWEVKFRVKSHRLGSQLTNVISDSRINYTAWDGDNMTLLFPEVWVYVLGVPDPPDPRVSLVPGTDHIRLEWTPPSSVNISHYLIFRAEDDPTAFDFSNPWANTLLDFDPVGLDYVDSRTSWNFTDDVTNAKEIYYCVKTVNDIGWISTSSYTMGKWTRTFPQGVSTFSLPLAPLGTVPPTADFYLNDMNASYIKWMNTTTRTWMKHGEGDFNDALLLMGEGYEVKFDAQTVYTFLGMPGAMIMHNEDAGFPGFNPDTNAKSITVTIEANGDVNITWQEPGGMGLGDAYELYCSNTRNGFFGEQGSDYTRVGIPVIFGTNYAVHFGAGADAPGTQLYYIVVPINATGFKGTSTYSIGIWSEEILSEYDTFGIPLKTGIVETVDWWCENIPDTVGINYFDEQNQLWSWHSTRMPKGVYDPELEIGKGYQVSTANATKFIFVGV